IADHDLLGGAARREAELDGLDPVGSRGGRALLEEELALGAVHVALQRHRAAGDAAERALGDREVVGDEIELGVSGLGEVDLVRVRDGHLVPGDLEDLLASGHDHTIGASGGRRDRRPPNRYPVRVDFYRTREGKTLRIGESDDGMLSVEILKDGAWTAAPLGMIGLRLSPETRRLKASEIKTLPN